MLYAEAMKRNSNDALLEVSLKMCKSMQRRRAPPATTRRECVKKKMPLKKRAVFLVIIYSSSFHYIVKFTVNKARKAPVHIDAPHAQDARTLTNVL